MQPKVCVEDYLISSIIRIITFPKTTAFKYFGNTAVLLTIYNICSWEHSHSRLSSVTMIPFRWQLAWLGTTRRYLQVWWNTRGCVLRKQERYYLKRSSYREIVEPWYRVFLNLTDLSVAWLCSMPILKRCKHFNIQFWHFEILKDFKITLFTVLKLHYLRFCNWNPAICYKDIETLPVLDFTSDNLVPDSI